MRNREGVLSLLLLGTHLFLDPPNNTDDPWAFFPGLVLLVSLVGHALSEGLRLLLLPTYLIFSFKTLEYAMLYLTILKEPLLSNTGVGYLVWQLLTVVLVLNIFFVILMPVGLLPKPSKCGVGTLTLGWTIRQYMDDKQGKRTFLYDREVFVKVWYPSDRFKGGETFQMFTEPSIALAKFCSLSVFRNFPFSIFPRIFLHYVSQMRGYAAYGTHIAPVLSRWPVLIFSCDKDSVPEYYTAICSELASQGFVIFAVYHVDDDTRYPGPLKRRQIDVEFLLKHLPDLNNNDEKMYKQKHIENKNWSDEINIFHNRLDLSRGVGIIGHGLGGTLAITMAQMQPDKIRVANKGYRDSNAYGTNTKSVVVEGDEKEKRDLSDLLRNTVPSEATNENNNSNNNNNTAQPSPTSDSSTTEQTTETTTTTTTTETETTKSGKGKSKLDAKPRQPKSGEQVLVSSCFAMDPDMDYMKVRQLGKRILCPLMIAHSDMWSRSNRQHVINFCQRAVSDKSIFECAMKQTSHENFTDMIFLITAPLYGRLLPLSMFKEISSKKESGTRLLGSEHPQILHQAVQRLLLLFFQYYLSVVPSATPPSSSSFHNIIPAETQLFTFKMHKKKSH